jgi:hypothetical protein
MTPENFLHKFNPEKSNFIKIHLVGVNLFQAYGLDRQTDKQTEMMKLTVTCCNFVNTPKKSNFNVTTQKATDVVHQNLHTVM